MSLNLRVGNRAVDTLREVNMEIGYMPHAEGSCLIRFGQTAVICTATVEDKVPHFIKGTGAGWVTAEYSMLPRSTNTRNNRDINRGSANGRTHEIQRLIGRALRASVDMKALGERQVIVDCDVIIADGGTRTASITGGFVALYMALSGLYKRGWLKKNPMQKNIAAVSCGIIAAVPMLDLDYKEDSTAHTDANFVMNAEGAIVEIQCTAEGKVFTKTELDSMLKLAEKGIIELIAMQNAAIVKAMIE